MTVSIPYFVSALSKPSNVLEACLTRLVAFSTLSIPGQAAGDTCRSTYTFHVHAGVVNWKKIVMKPIGQPFHGEAPNLL